MSSVGERQSPLKKDSYSDVGQVPPPSSEPRKASRAAGGLSVVPVLASTHQSRIAVHPTLSDTLDCGREGSHAVHRNPPPPPSRRSAHKLCPPPVEGPSLTSADRKSRQSDTRSEHPEALLFPCAPPSAPSLCGCAIRPRHQYGCNGYWACPRRPSPPQGRVHAFLGRQPTGRPRPRSAGPVANGACSRAVADPVRATTCLVYIRRLTERGGRRAMDLPSCESRGAIDVYAGLFAGSTDPPVRAAIHPTPARTAHPDPPRRPRT